MRVSVGASVVWVPWCVGALLCGCIRVWVPWCVGEWVSSFEREGVVRVCWCAGVRYGGGYRNRLRQDAPKRRGWANSPMARWRFSRQTRRVRVCAQRVRRTAPKCARNGPSARVRQTCARVRPVRQRRTRALLNEPKMRQEVRLLRKGRRGRRPERDGGDLLSAIGRSVRVDACSGLSQRSREPH